MSRELALEAGTTMDTAIVIEKVVYGLLNNFEWRRRGGVVKIHI